MDFTIARELPRRRHVGDERLVDLDFRKRHLPQHLQRRIAGAEFVDRQVHPLQPDPAQDIHRSAGLLEHRALGDLETKMVRRHAAGPQPLLETIRQGQVVQVLRRYVHRQRHLKAKLRQHLIGFHRGAHDPVDQGIGEVRLFSAIGRKSPGGIRPRTGCSQRTSASSFFNAFGCRVTSGWKSSTSSSSAMASSSRSPDSDCSARLQTFEHLLERLDTQRFFQHLLDLQTEALPHRMRGGEHPGVIAAHQHQRAGVVAIRQQPHLLHPVRATELQIQNDNLRWIVSEMRREGLGVGDRRRLHTRHGGDPDHQPAHRVVIVEDQHTHCHTGSMVMVRSVP